jgi:hypothetical protein
MRIALRKFDPEFTIWTLADYDSLLLSWYPYSDKNLPFVALGDFNGDSVQDAILHGHNRSADIILCILSANKSFKVSIIEKWEVSDWSQSDHFSIYITKISPGLINSGFENEPLQIATDAFEISYFEKASTLYYYKNGKFLQYTTSD